MKNDAAFFAEHPDRRYRIRESGLDEFDAEFRSLGLHDEKRRRVIVYRLPRHMAIMYGADLVPIPMLLFADESIEDTDEVLASVFRGIMEDARKRGGDRTAAARSDVACQDGRVRSRAERRRLLRS